MATTTQKANGEAPANLPAKQTRPIDTLRDLLEKQKGQIAKALPRHLTADRMIRVAVTAVQRMPALLECSPLSVVGCVMQACELGLEMSGPLGQAYMIPYQNKQTGQREAQFQIGYRGLIRLAYNSGQVSTFNAHVVYQGDKFSFRYGTRPELEHVPAMSGRGQPVAVYAVLRLKDGSTDFEVMSVEDVNRHRGKYSRSGKDSPWETAWDEMARKTVIRRLAKRAPLSAECQAAAVEDEHNEARLAEPAIVGGRFGPLGDGGADPVDGPAEGEVVEAGDARE